jgi:hypothetical protein
LPASQWARASDEARQLIAEWTDAGWMHSAQDEEPTT